MNLQTKLGTARRDLLTQAASCHADPENCDEGADVIVVRRDCVRLMP